MEIDGLKCEHEVGASRLKSLTKLAQFELARFYGSLKSGVPRQLTRKLSLLQP
jgi:hypothetical protein